MAQALPVGRSQRVRHGAESNSAMVVRNKPEGWSCYCHRCKAGGFVPKEFVQYAPEAVQEDWVQKLPSDLRELTLRDWEKLGPALARKGLDPVMLRRVSLQWSDSAERLVIGMPSGKGYGYIGRSFQSHVSPKVVCYSTGAGYPAYLNLPEPRTGGVVVITEDALSAIKVDWATRSEVSVFTSLGTRMAQALVLQVLSLQPTEVVVFYDGDKAGYKGADDSLKRLRGLGIPCRSESVPDKDPKDLTAAEIRRLLYGRV